MDEWLLTRAEYAIRGVNPDAEPGAGAGTAPEAERRVAAGDWTRREMTLAGRPATVYLSPRDGAADDRIDSIHVYLPDALIDINVWAPVDPLLVLEALTPVR